MGRNWKWKGRFDLRGRRAAMIFLLGVRVLDLGFTDAVDDCTEIPQTNEAAFDVCALLCWLATS